MRNRKIIIVLGIAGAFLFICIIGTLFGRGGQPAQPTTAPTATQTTLPATPMPTPMVWTVQAPEGLSYELFTKDALTDESCLDCVLGDLVGGTKLTPADEGCQQATWDASYIYCHVLVLDGDLAGTYGWVDKTIIPPPTEPPSPYELIPESQG